jgi:hypothetical protein
MKITSFWKIRKAIGGGCVVSGQRHAPAAFYPRERTPVYPIDPWFESRSGHFSSILMNYVFGTLMQFIY